MCNLFLGSFATPPIGFEPQTRGDVIDLFLPQKTKIARSPRFFIHMNFLLFATMYKNNGLAVFRVDEHKLASTK